MKKQFVILIKLNKDIVKYVLDGLLYFSLMAWKYLGL
jgi:hypothetical protein